MFGERLFELRKEKGCTQKDIGDLLGISDRAVGHYESGRNEPDISTLQTLANFFGVSTDYLLGRTDRRNETVELSTTAAHRADDPLSDLDPEDLEKVNSYIAFIRSQKQSN